MEQENVSGAVTAGSMNGMRRFKGRRQKMLSMRSIKSTGTWAFSERL